MENILNDITKDIINKIKDTEVKNIVLQNEITPEQQAIIESIKMIKNPFKMLTVQDIMKDLNICETIAYRTFKRPDFPSINIGKNNQVMLISYLVWKMQKRV